MLPNSTSQALPCHQHTPASVRLLPPPACMEGGEEVRNHSAGQEARNSTRCCGVHGALTTPSPPPAGGRCRREEATGYVPAAGGAWRRSWPRAQALRRPRLRRPRQQRRPPSQHRHPGNAVSWAKFQLQALQALQVGLDPWLVSKGACSPHETIMNASPAATRCLGRRCFSYFNPKTLPQLPTASAYPNCSHFGTCP